MRYRNYDPRVKQMIIHSRNPNLFPDLRIPRTTALYWINKSKSIKGRMDESILKNEVNELKRDNFNLKAKNLLLKEILKSGLDFELKNSLVGRQRREKIVEIVESFKDVLKTKEILDVLGISFSTYYRYRVEILGCVFTNKKCDSTYGRALSHECQKRMIDLAKDQRFAHFSIRSLAYYAQREGILSCGIDSWYKYLRINNVARPRVSKRKPNRYGVGIRAKKPNELWHIDVTQVKTKNFRKVYLQLVVDNFSRFILSFKVGHLKDLKLSLRTLRSLKLEDGHRNSYLMSDGGGENVNKKVRRILIGKGITHLIAKSDVNFSNSIVEAVFRQMKRIDEIRNPKSFYSFKRAVENYVSEHNTLIPHSALRGATPAEMHMGNRVLDYKNRLKEVRVEDRQISKMWKKNCRRCLVQFKAREA